MKRLNAREQLDSVYDDGSTQVERTSVSQIFTSVKSTNSYIFDGIAAAAWTRQMSLCAFESLLATTYTYVCCTLVSCALGTEFLMANCQLIRRQQLATTGNALLLFSFFIFLILLLWQPSMPAEVVVQRKSSLLLLFMQFHLHNILIFIALLSMRALFPLRTIATKAHRNVVKLICFYHFPYIQRVSTDIKSMNTKHLL